MTTRLRSWAGYSETVAYVVAAALALIAAWFALDLWTLRWDVPLVYRGDALAVGSHFKTVIDAGWYEHQPALGAPFGQTYHDYPTSENLHFAVAALLGMAGASWGMAMNLHFVLGFPLAAVAMVWFLRRVEVSLVLAVTLGVVFSIAPFHFIRGEGHLFLSWYWVVPLALGLIWSVLRSEPIWGRRKGISRGLGHLGGPTGGTIAILAVLGSSSIYFSAFTLVLGGVAAVAAVWVKRDWRRLRGALAAAGVLVTVMVANLAPDLIYRIGAGPNPGALQRTPVETEIYALKLSQLLLPAPYHRFEPFRYLREQYDQHYPLPSESPALGLVASVGLVVLMVAVFYLLARVVTARGVASKGQSTNDSSPLSAQLAPLSFLALLAFVFATVGGLSTLISFVSTNLRAWNRISIVIAALSLAAVALLLDALHRRLRASAGTSKVPRPLVLVCVALLVLGLSFWDQAPPPDPAGRSATVAAFDSDAEFASELELALAPGSMLFQLPYRDFPESPPLNGVLDSDQFRPFLHSNELRFSGGGIRGREAIDSLGDLAERARSDPDGFVREARKLGFFGVIVDALGFVDAEQADALVRSLGGADITSPNGRLIFVEIGE